MTQLAILREARRRVVGRLRRLIFLDVASGARGTQRGVLIVDVARRALNTGVLAGQRELGLAVVEGGA